MTWMGAGHEADARVLQQQLSSLVLEQQAAQQFITDNPPPAVTAPQHQQVGKQDGPKAAASTTEDWKWDILRPVSLPVELK